MRVLVSPNVLAACWLAVASSALWAVEPGAEPWRELYTGEEATGPRTIALWQFLPGQEARDSSGRGHDLTLRGEVRFVREGPFGAALESFRAGTDDDRPQGAIAKDADDLSPAGAFTLEAWIMAKPEMDQQANVFLFDKKYYNYARDLPEANWDYCLYLERSGPHRRRLRASLGYGQNSDFLTGPEIALEPGRWVHIAYTYDGAGRSRFFVDGVLAGKVEVPDRGPVSPGRYDLTIGDRFGSTHTGFPGYIAQARLSDGIVPYFTGGLTMGLGGNRSVFVRMERGATLAVVVGNDTPETMSEGRVQVAVAGRTQELSLPDLAPNAEYAIPLAFDTTLRPGDYPLHVQASAAAGGRQWQVEKEFAVTIVPRRLPHQMPVVMWGSGDLKQLKSLGFTHELIHLADVARIWRAGAPVPALPPGDIAERGAFLDELLRQGLYGAVYLYPGTWVTGDAQRRAKYNRVDRAGEVRAAENVCGNFPEIQQFCYNVGASVAQTFGHHPALDSSLIHSEVRDASDLCFHEHDRQLYREATGQEIPDEAAGKSGLSYRRLKGFPANRVVKDDDRILTFYRWFWKDGDGWNRLHSEVSRGLKSTGRTNLWTFFDPAVRVPDTWGSGGDVDVISQWTYSYPDPIKIGQATDELFAMAEGKPGQQVMKMTQIIWYRSGTAPELPADEAARASWEREKPEAPFITIAPDHLREAFWSKLSRPVRGIMYHGWGSLVETGTTNQGYVFTNPRTAEVLTELTHNVVRPLGPTLLQVPDRPADVAILQSFSSQVFAGRGTYGWSESWEASMHLILQWAHLQPRIVFDETVVRDGLDQYKVLFMPFCDVLTESVVARIREFQRRGGIVVADEHLCPAILPDIVIPSYKRTGKAQEDKAALQALAADLRRELDPFYTRYGDATDPDLVLRFRKAGASDYLFALNDKRTYGDYVGHHGKVMEQGLPLNASISVARAGVAVYDLVRHSAVEVRRDKAETRWDVSLGPGDGTVYLLTPRGIADLRLQAPEVARRGQALQLMLSVVDSGGDPVPAVVPVQLTVTDPKGREAEFSGYYGAANGRLQVRLDLAPNDEAGTWRVTARELASGRRAQHRFTVSP